jgi:hypothetical protein
LFCFSIKKHAADDTVIQVHFLARRLPISFSRTTASRRPHRSGSHRPPGAPRFPLAARAREIAAPRS